MDNRILEILNYLEDHLDQNHSLAELSQRACLSQSQFYRLFKKETHNAPIRFIEKLKMRKAYHWLISDNLLVSEVTYLLGYNDYETFSRNFKKHYKISPDDLKSVAAYIRKQLDGSKEDKIITVPIEKSENISTLFPMLEKCIQNQRLSPEDLKRAKIFLVEEAGSKTTQKLRVKNKFLVSPEEKLWKSLLKKTIGKL